jgi:formate dehydrogenase subunit gamma
MGYTLFSWLAVLGKNLHNFVGPLFAVCIIFLFANFVRDNFPQPGDWLWIKRFGGLFSGRDTPSYKYNAGEKIWFWGGAIVLAVLVSATGFILDFPLIFLVLFIFLIYIQSQESLINTNAT